MHLTRIRLKDGTELSGFIDMWRPWENWLSLMRDHRISFDDIESAITENERIDIRTIADQDEVDRARKYLAEGRQCGWPDIPKEKFKWELE